MKELSSKLYNNLDGKMKMTSLRSAYTIYNDKQMTKEQSDYTALIKEWNSRLTDAEDAYYKKFASMESTLSKLNSNSSSLSGMF
jgi:flagellar hook-associated protein 2